MIREAFYIENIQRIIKGERLFIKEKINELKNQLNNFSQLKKNLNQKVRME